MCAHQTIKDILASTFVLAHIRDWDIALPTVGDGYSVGGAASLCIFRFSVT